MFIDNNLNGCILIFARNSMHYVSLVYIMSDSHSRSHIFNLLKVCNLYHMAIVYRQHIH